HYILSDLDERRFYEIEAENNNWSVRELNRQFDSALYQRLAISRDKKDALVEITLPDETNPIFASRWKIRARVFIRRIKKGTCEKSASLLQWGCTWGFAI
nr:hypothetical protein [Bacteroidales bacterium]